MKYIVPILILLAACQSESEIPDWLLGEWISDPELTISENNHFSDLGPEEIDAIRNMLGTLRWEVTDSSLTVIRPESSSRSSFEYSVEVIDDSEVLFSSEDAGDMKLRRINGGICADFTPLPGVEPLLVSECFARYDT